MRICCAGEVMVEMAATERPGHYLCGVAGDTYNTAVYLVRAGLQVDYLTRLGDDPLSARIVEQLRAEGIGTDWVARSPGRQPGLYLIDNDAGGERRFSYWRDSAPARQTFDTPLDPGNWHAFYFSGITLAVTRSGFDHLLALLGRLSADGCRIVFDPNYRPRLWDDAAQARDHITRVLPLCHTVLPTLADDAALWGCDSVGRCRDHYLAAGVAELVIKGEDLAAHAFAGEEYLVRKAQPVAAVDTTGAGDAFAAGYLAARLAGGDIATALARAQTLAAAVVQQRGAILPRARGSAR